jgi:branched-chain amino acid transport system ATP-binding protein
VLLDLQKVTVRYGKALALKKVSLQVQPGEVVALLGSNGAGKTTTLKVISGLKRPATGQVVFKGKPLMGLPPQVIVGLGIAHVPEGRRVFSEMTVLENLLMGAYLRSDRDGIARDQERIFHSFPALKERRGQKAGSLSGGEQQMLAMGRALMSRPELLLLDEPSLGLSPLLVREVAGIIREIKQTGVSIILIEQNARMALKLANRAYILDMGSLILEGEAGALLADERVQRAYLGT